MCVCVCLWLVAFPGMLHAVLISHYKRLSWAQFHAALSEEYPMRVREELAESLSSLVPYELTFHSRAAGGCVSSTIKAVGNLYVGYGKFESR